MAGVGSRTFAASSRGVMHTSSVSSSTTLLVRLKKSLCRLKKPGGCKGWRLALEVRVRSSHDPHAPPLVYSICVASERTSEKCACSPAC